MSIPETADLEATPHPKPTEHKHGKNGHEVFRARHNGANGHNNGTNGHKPTNGHNLNLGQLAALPHSIINTAEKKITANIDELRQQIRQQLIIFTEAGSGRRLIDHHNAWHEAMEAINRLSLSDATDPKEIEELGEKAKALVIAAWQNKPALLRLQQIQELRKLAAGNPPARELILEELSRIGKEDLVPDFLE